MDVSSGIEAEENTTKACKLKKSFYGLKQSPRTWFDQFTKFIKRFGCSQYQSDHTLSTKNSTEGRIAIILINVDDIILTKDHEKEICELKKSFC